MDELAFDVVQEADGGFCAECLSESIVTEGDTWEELRRNVQEVVRAFYFDQPKKLPDAIRLRLARDASRPSSLPDGDGSGKFYSLENEFVRT